MAILKVDACLLKPFTTRNLLLKLSHVLHPGPRAFGTVPSASSGMRLRARECAVTFLAVQPVRIRFVSFASALGKSPPPLPAPRKPSLG